MRALALAKSLIIEGLHFLIIAVRTLLVTVMICLCALFITSFVLWDYDFYVARGKFESFKVAMFGEWQPNSQLLAGADEISLFRREIVPGFGAIVTGAGFAVSNGEVEPQVTTQWCYVSHGNGIAKRRVDLGTQDGTGPASYSDFQSIPQDVLNELGVSASRLSDLARANCRFDSFDTSNPR